MRKRAGQSHFKAGLFQSSHPLHKEYWGPTTIRLNAPEATSPWSVSSRVYYAPATSHTLPPCTLCYRAMHCAARDERARWQAAGVDPIQVARRLWKDTRIDEGGLSPTTCHKLRPPTH